MRTIEPPYQEIARLRFAIRRFEAAAERIAREEGVGPRTYLVLLAIKSSSEAGERTSVNMIARSLQLATHSVSGAVQRCEERGLVRREPCSVDARRTWIHLTSEGERRLARIATQLEHDREALLDEFDRQPRPRRPQPGGTS